MAAEQKAVELLFNQKTIQLVLNRIEAARKRSEKGGPVQSPEQKSPQVSKIRRYGRRAKVLALLYGIRRIPMK
jgi:hypothetical protein